MICNFVNAGFAKGMQNVLVANNIKRIEDPAVFCPQAQVHNIQSKEDEYGDNHRQEYLEILKEVLEKGPYQEIDGMTNICYSYFSHVIDDGGAEVIFCQQNEKKFYPFLLERKEDSNTYILYSTQKGALSYFVRNSIYGSNGLIYGFEKECKAYIDSEFSAGHLAISNNYNSMISGLSLQQDIIQKTLLNRHNIDLDNRLSTTLVKAVETSGSPDHLKDMRYLYSSYVMGVFSFIEHVAVLILPFWYSLRDSYPYWNNFCDGFHPSGFDSYRDFWTSKLNWIDSFIETLCEFKRYNSRTPQGTFSYNATDTQKLAKRLYERLRIDYRNPVHHGFSTGENKTGLSMEVPSLKSIVWFNSPPLLRELDTTAYEQTKEFFELFISVVKTHNQEIFKYIATGWNIPVDCSELAQYVLNENMKDFINEYESEIFSKKDILIDQFSNGYGYNWVSVTGRKY